MKQISGTMYAYSYLCWRKLWFFAKDVYKRQDKDGKYIRQERYAGSMSRSFFIGKNIPKEDIKAKYEDGVLRLSVPKKDIKVIENNTISIE